MAKSSAGFTRMVLNTRYKIMNMNKGSIADHANPRKVPLNRNFMLSNER